MEQLGQVPQLIVTGIANGCVYAIVAVGFSIIYNSTQVINFAQGEFVMIGAMVAAALTVKHSLLVAFPAALVAGCLVGAFVALCLLARLRRASVITFIIVTVGASIMFRGVAQLVWGEEALPVPPFTGVRVGQYIEDRTFHLWGSEATYTAVSAQQLWVVGVTALLVILMHLFFKRTLVGQAMRACAMNSSGARLVGISVRKMIVLSFAMAAGLGAAAGVTVAPVSQASFAMGTGMGLRGFCAAVLGGFGSFGGGIVAGLVLGVVESIAGGLLWSDYKDAIAFVILIAILFVKPEGLLSRRRAEA